MENILIVEDNENMQVLLKDLFAKSGFQTRSAFDGFSALEEIKKASPDLILLDLKLPDIDGLSVLKEAKKIDPNLQVIIITAHGDIRSAVEAMKLGAYEFVTKPFDNKILLELVKKSVEARKIYKKIEIAEEDFCLLKGEKFFFKSPAIKKILSTVKIVAPTDMTVIIEGESGSGKEIIARLIHEISPRKEEPFVAIDCGAVSETLVESELFGHEKGAFTGADSQRIGQFEKANKGTLFLDEITNFSDNIQKKFLRVLEEKKLQRLGGENYIGFDVRILVASNANIAEEVHRGRFREDLFHRLNEFTIKIPPLRERLEDITVLAMHFLNEANLEFGKKVLRISEDGMNFLLNYNWPGNIRQLKNAIRRAVLLADEKSLKNEELSKEILASSIRIEEIDFGKETLQKTLPEVESAIEARMIRETLEKTGGNKAEAARILNISRKTLYRKIKEFNLEQFDT